MPERVAAALKQHFQRSNYTGADDLVFCHPETGAPFDASKMRKRFRVALKAAGVRSIRFHDLRHTFGTRMAFADERSRRTLTQRTLKTKSARPPGRKAGVS